MPSSRTRRVTEGGLKREYVHAPLHSMCGMAVPQLVWVDVEPGGFGDYSKDQHLDDVGHRHQPR